MKHPPIAVSVRVKFKLMLPYRAHKPVALGPRRVKPTEIACDAQGY